MEFVLIVILFVFFFVGVSYQKKVADEKRLMEELKKQKERKEAERLEIKKIRHC